MIRLLGAIVAWGVLRALFWPLVVALAIWGLGSGISLPSIDLDLGGSDGGERQANRAIVVRAVDGDTLVVRLRGGERTVRMIGLDSPESVRPGHAVECGAKGAARSLARLARAGASVRLAVDEGGERVDGYGRLLRYVESRGRDLGRAQVARGWGEPYVYSQPFGRLAAYEAAAARASAAGRGGLGPLRRRFSLGRLKGGGDVATDDDEVGSRGRRGMRGRAGATRARAGTRGAGGRLSQGVGVDAPVRAQRPSGTFGGGDRRRDRGAPRRRGAVGGVAMRVLSARGPRGRTRSSAEQARSDLERWCAWRGLPVPPRRDARAASVDRGRGGG
ncbi:MAG: hypothetical protein GEU88_18430 [Solirubrobacterales bacterium]|nr:hypothetical protein [Solirubrobacterales bacterium]